MASLHRNVNVGGMHVELDELEAAMRAHSGVRDAAVSVDGDGAAARLVGYVVRDTHPAELRAPQRTRLNEWQQVWRSTHQRTDPSAADFVLCGWTSSYTGQPIPAGEMARWADSAVNRLKALQPGTVLEIGCGTGLILTRLAPACARYTALDFSPEAIASLGEYTRRRPELQHVELRQAPANDFGGAADDSFDLVVLNSVVQYFPDLDYLTDVLAEAVRVARPGGHVFVGDVRSLLLLPAYHVSVQMARAEPHLPVSALKTRIAKAQRFDRELPLLPEFFADLVRQWSKVGRVELLPKLGRYDNELSRFRYDVVIRIGDKEVLEPPDESLAWDEGGKWRESLIAASRGASIEVRGVPDRRTAETCAAMRLLESAPGETSVAKIRDASRGANGEDFDQLEEFVREHQSRLVWRGFHADGTYDVLFHPRWRAAAAQDVSRGPTADDAAFASSLRDALRRLLPDDLLPAIVVLARLPRMANGELDRRSLPA